MDVRLLGPWIDYPNVAYAEGKIVVDALLHLRHPVVFRENLDAEKRRRSEDLLPRFVSRDHTHVGNAKSRGLDLHALLRENVYPKLAATIVKVGAQKHLKLAMIFFPHIALQELPVEVLTVRTVAAREVFLDRDQRAALHEPRIL